MITFMRSIKVRLHHMSRYTYTLVNKDAAFVGHSSLMYTVTSTCELFHALAIHEACLGILKVLQIRLDCRQLYPKIF